MMNQTKDSNEDNGREGTSKAASMSPIKEGNPATADDGPEIDDQGTGQAEAADILRGLRDNAFDGSDEKLAVALGRPAEEIGDGIKGEETIDGDLVLKAKTLAAERGVTEDSPTES